MQEEEYDEHAALSDERLVGHNPMPPAYQRLLSLHASLIGLRCRYFSMLHHWSAQLAAFSSAVTGRSPPPGDAPLHKLSLIHI